MAVKAKFRVRSVTDTGFQKEVNLEAIYGSKGENADFSKATPSGSLKLIVDNETKAAQFFRPQTNYYLTIEEAPND